MALIVEYHVVADMYPVGATAISAGMNVAMGTDGLIIPSGTSQTAGTVLGIAGDSRLTAEGQTTAYSDQVNLGADGAGTRWTENRVSDFYDETLASQKVTVYTGGGKFWVSEDLVDSAAAIAINNILTISGVTAGHWADGGTATAGTDYAIAVGANQAYPSGVPGTDVDGHITLGNYVPLLLKL